MTEPGATPAPPGPGDRAVSPGPAGPAEPPTARARRVAVVAWAAIGVLVLAALVLWALARLAIVVVPLLIALFPAAALTPLRHRMVRSGWPRALAALTLVLGLLVVIAGLVAGPIPALVDEIPTLVDSIATAVQQLQEFLARLPGGARLGNAEQLAGDAAAAVLGADPVAGTVGVAVTAVTVLSGVVLAVLALYFLLYQGDRIARGAADLLVPRRRRADALELGDQLWTTLGAYVRAQLLIGLIDAVLIGLGIWLLGVPAVVPLALLIFVGAQVPIIGAFVAGSVAVLVALADGGLGVAAATLAVILGVQFAEGQFLEPALMSRLVRLPAFAVIVAVAIGTALLGVLGALLAVPVAACVVRTGAFLRDRRARGEATAS
ncbi:AI-2E family transporter [Pseudonocardia nigra]|uniref:AI-2E family transporter n=1 Tax=Pseudonocardia nigra TaxID=1921578 RepID=UPI001C5E21D5|nr:AI-2E family transporter [Pseudonocardia nigra]